MQIAKVTKPIEKRLQDRSRLGHSARSLFLRERLNAVRAHEIYLCPHPPDFDWVRSDRSDRVCYGTNIRAFRVSLFNWTNSVDKNIDAIRGLVSCDGRDGSVDIGANVCAVGGRFSQNIRS